MTNKQRIAITTSIVALFFSLSGKIYAGWSEWYTPTRFEGMTYSDTNYTNITNLADTDNNAYATIDVQFGSPAPQIFRKSLGFSNYLEVNKAIKEVEVKFSVRRRYSVTPYETLEMYLIKEDQGTVATALNATTSLYYESITNTSFQEKTYYWRDTEGDTDVSNYFGDFDPYNFTIAIGAYKNNTSGSTNFVDIGYLQIRFYTEDTTTSNTVANPTRTYIAYENLKTSIEQKAPFAYFAAVGSLDFSNVETEDFTINFPVIINGSPTFYPATLPEGAVTALETIRTLIGVAITGFIIIYLITTGNKIFGGDS